MTTCPDDNVLAALSEGRLSAEQRTEVEAHLDGCAACFQLLASLGPAYAETELLPIPAQSLRPKALARGEVIVQGTVTILHGCWLLAAWTGLALPGQWLFGESFVARLLDGYAAVWSLVGFAVSAACSWGFSRGWRSARALSLGHAIASLPTLFLTPLALFVLRFRSEAGN